MTWQQKAIHELISGGGLIPLYKFPHNIRNHTARISELRGMGYVIENRKRKNYQGNVMSEYRMGVEDDTKT